jgi:hypothetical protein
MIAAWFCRHNNDCREAATTIGSVRCAPRPQWPTSGFDRDAPNFLAHFCVFCGQSRQSQGLTVDDTLKTPHPVSLALSLFLATPAVYALNRPTFIRVTPSTIHRWQSFFF